MKYSVKVKEISYGVVEVEATSAEEAEEKAESVYYDGKGYGCKRRYGVRSLGFIPCGKGKDRYELYVRAYGKKRRRNSRRPFGRYIP